MAFLISKKTCCPRKWGCGRAFPETAEYFRPFKGRDAGYFNAYCYECERKKQRKPKAIIESHGAKKGCLSILGCSRMLRESDFHRGQSLCKKCYSLRYGRKRRYPKPIVEPHSDEMVCRSKLGCGKRLPKSDFYRGRVMCRHCYDARWTPRVREKRRLRRAKLLKLGHGLTHSREGSFPSDSEKLPRMPRHPVGSEDAMHELLEMAGPRVDGQ